MCDLLDVVKGFEKLNTPLKELKDIEKKTATTELSSINKDCFDSSLFDKKLVTNCVLSAVVAVITAFAIMKIGMHHNDEKIQDIIEKYTSVDNRVNSIMESISFINGSIDTLKDDLKSGKDESSYIYTSLSSLQRDVTAIKKELHITTENTDDLIKKLSSEKASFIESFENLIKDGAPFGSFIESSSSKVDIKKYTSSNKLLTFSKQKIKSTADLEKDFAAVGLKVFNVKFAESFWEKQKRFIKERISEAITIRNSNEKKGKVDKTLNDKALFKTASKQLSEGRVEDAIATLDEIKIKNEELSSLILEMKKRNNLDKAFAEFKKEFLEIESTSLFHPSSKD